MSMWGPLTGLVLSVVGDRVYALESLTTTSRIRVWDLDGTRQASEDVDLIPGTVAGLQVTDTRIYVVSHVDEAIRVWDRSGTRQSSEDIDLGTGTWTAVTVAQS